MSSLQDDPISVLKFGSSVLRSEADLPLVVHEIYSEWRRGRRVLVVASAFGSTTDDLLAQARQQSPRPTPRILAELLATGESTSASLLALALERAGVPTRLISPKSIGLRTEGGHLDAHPVGLDTDAIQTEFQKAPVLVLPGFISHRDDGQLALLGRGGSDMSAIFVAGRLGEDTRCVLVKDVAGFFEWDPASSTEETPRRFAQISYGDALELSGDVVQHKAIRLARESGLSFEVGSVQSLSSSLCDPVFGETATTKVGPGPSRLCSSLAPHFTRLRVGIIGHGTVGAGVLQHLLKAPEDFDVVSVLVRDLAKHRNSAGSQCEELFTDDPERFFGHQLDVLVEVAGGVTPAREWVERGLTAGLDVVTANKALMAECGRELIARARAQKARLAYHAAVGGSAPLLETARRIASPTIRGVEAVLNGTSNFILEGMGRGLSLGDALAQAQEHGYAEADPTLDLDGTDAAQKIELLARELYGSEVILRWGNRTRVADIPAALFEEARASHGVLRLVASCYLEEPASEDGTPGSVSVQLSAVNLPTSHPLSRVNGAGGGAVFDCGSEEKVFVFGEGAGRWPTAEAVFADLLDLRRAAAPSFQRER